MDAEKTKSRKRGTANGGREFVLQWGSSKRLRGVKKEPSSANNATGVLRKAIRADRRVNKAGKQAWRPHKQASGDIKPSPPTTNLHSQARKPVKRYSSCVSSAPGSGNNSKQKLTTPSKSLAKSRVDKSRPEKSDKTSISTTKDTEMVVARTSLEAGLPVGKFHNEIQSLEVFLLPKFMIALSHKEKEEDFMAIKGSKLPIRPKKRAKHVQKALHCVSPGSWLCELSLDRYEVREKKSVQKKSWGLKAMASGDSDSH